MMISTKNGPVKGPSSLAHLDRALFELLRLKVQRGHKLELTVPTGSMIPIIRPGDTIIVAWPPTPLAAGDLLVFWREGILVCHQIRRLFTLVDQGEANLPAKSFVQTSGTNGRLDPQLSMEDVLGIARVEGNWLISA